MSNKQVQTQVGLRLGACARTASDGGLDEPLHRRCGNQQQLGFRFFHLFNDGELLRLPGIGSGLAFCDGVERGKACCPQGGEILRVGGYFFHEERALRERLKYRVVIAPSCQLCAQPCL